MNVHSKKKSGYSYCLLYTSTEDAVEEQLGTTLLGSIYHERKNRTFKAKIAQKVKVLLITSPIISTRFIESINNIRVKMEYEHERNPEKNVYMVTSVCENEGKSTVALNLAPVSYTHLLYLIV